MKWTRAGLATVLVLTCALAGCDHASPTAEEESASLAIALDLSTLQRTEASGALQACVDVIAEAALTVGDVEQTRQAVAQGQRQVRFDQISVESGQSVGAEVRSSNGTVLYGGAAPVSDANLDQGTLTLNLNKQSPVLRVCLDQVVLALDRSRDLYVDSLKVYNIGSDTLIWTTEAPPRVAFDVPEGRVGAGDSVTVDVVSSTFQPQPLTARIISDAGALLVQVSMSGTSPVAVDDFAATDEDTPVVISVLDNDDNAGGGALTLTDVSDPGTGTVEVLDGNTQVRYTPAADSVGTDVFTYRARNDVAVTDTAAVTVTVNAVNDAPSFAIGADQQVDEDAGPQEVSGWATAIRAGPPNEREQTLTFMFTANDNPSLFAAPPSLSPDGTLTYTPSDDANGEANLTVVLTDNGGTDNGGEDTSTPQRFTITVRAVNDPPVAASDMITVEEDARDVAVDVLANDSDPEGDAITLLATRDPAFGEAFVEGREILYSAVYEPVLVVSDQDAFTYVIEDEHGLQDEGVVTVQINPCIDFDESIDAGRYGEANAGRLFAENDIPVTLGDFIINDQSFLNFVDVRSSDGGQDVFFNNATLEFDLSAFSELTDRTVRYVRFFFVDQGGSINLAVNGILHAVRDFSEATEWPEGLTAEVVGSTFIVRADPAARIDALRIGGQELLLDDVCFGEEEP